MFQQTEGVSGDSIMHRNVNGRSMKSLGDVVSGKSKRLCKTNETCRALKPHTITQGSNPTNIPCNLKKSFFSSHLRHKIQQKSFFFFNAWHGIKVSYEVKEKHLHPKQRLLHGGKKKRTCPSLTISTNSRKRQVGDTQSCQLFSSHPNEAGIQAEQHFYKNTTRTYSHQVPLCKRWYLRKLILALSPDPLLTEGGSACAPLCFRASPTMAEPALPAPQPNGNGCRLERHAA